MLLFVSRGQGHLRSREGFVCTVAEVLLGKACEMLRGHVKFLVISQQQISPEGKWFLQVMISLFQGHSGW